MVGVMMKKNALRKDFFMEIRKSMGRFLSIFFIVALGVSLFVGIRATKPDMILSGDAYVDENKLMDIKVVSTYGLTEEDMEVLEKLPAIEMVEGAYSVDVLCEAGENMKVLHMMSRTESMNTVTVIKGRLPKKATECLVDEDFLESSEYEIGDEIEVVSGTDEELKETLKRTRFKIVGAGNSPLYFSLDRGSSTIGNGSVSGFMLVAPKAFTLDVYTEVYAMVKGAEEVLSFTEEYDDLVEEAAEQIEMIQNMRCEVRKDDLAAQAQLKIDDARSELNEKKKEAESEIAENEKKLEDAEIDIKIGKVQLESGKTSLQSGKTELEAGRAEYETGKAEYESGWAEYENAKALIESGKKEIESGKAELAAGKATLAEKSAPLDQTIDSLQTQKGALEKQILELQGQLVTAMPEQVAALQTQIGELQAKLREVDTQLQALATQREQLFGEAERQLAASEKLLQEKEAELLKGEQELVAAWQKLASAKQELDVAEQELLKGEQELAKSEQTIVNSEKELASGEKEIQEGKQELEDAKKELVTQIADGESEINDAAEEISEIELPVWYVFDRSSIPEYTGYGDNADRIDALSIVFPSIFFLVAALISLTTMTRMVEEQRVQIGTLKALGYSKFDIMKKYLNYAMLATFGGSILGVLIGEKLFPYVIIVAYKIMYIHIPHVILPYHWGYGVIATLIAVLCTGAATIFACYKELLAQPAILMRPEAPKIGKRTLIEKIPFVWKHLSFTWKSSLRNLFRYKKRFFMTLFGIGGCMGLLMVGYGLRDSITSVGTYQYEDLQTYDASVFIDEEMEDAAREELHSYLDENANVAAYTNVHMSSITTQNDDNEVDAYLTVIDDVENVAEFFTYRNRVSKEKYKLGNQGVILTEKTADMLNVDVGDTIRISEEGKNEQKVKITAICENYAGHYVYLTSTLYEKLYDKKPFYNNILIKSGKGTTYEKLQAVGEEILEYDDILNVQYTADLSAQLDDMLTALDQVMIVLIVVAGMLSFVVLYNLNNINITERRRELATLKVLGFYDMEVAEYVYRENMMLTLLGVLVGCGIGRFLHLFTIKTVEVDAAMFGRDIFPASYLICALITIGFSAFVNWIMYFKLKKIDMVESLKSVE